MSDYIAKIERLENGFTVEVPDPVAQKNNSDPKKPWTDPWKEYAFSTSEEVMAFLATVLGKVKPPKGDDMATNFQRAVEADK